MLKKILHYLGLDSHDENYIEYHAHFKTQETFQYKILLKQIQTLKIDVQTGMILFKLVDNLSGKLSRYEDLHQLSELKIEETILILGGYETHQKQKTLEYLKHYLLQDPNDIYFIQVYKRFILPSNKKYRIVLWGDIFQSQELFLESCSLTQQLLQQQLLCEKKNSELEL